MTRSMQSRVAYLVDTTNHRPRVAWLPRQNQVIPLHLISVVHGTLIAPLMHMHE